MVSNILTIGPLRSAAVKSTRPRIMKNTASAPVTIAVFAAMTVLLYGCMAYDAASTAVDAGTTVVSTTGHIVISPFGSGADSEKKSN